MSHFTHDKGDLGVAMVQASLIKMGYSILVPLSSASPFDLVAIINNEFKRIQVKFVTSKNGAIEISPVRLNKSKDKITGVIIKSNIEFDILAIYCPCTNLCYYVKRDEFTKAIRLRLTHPKNNQSIGVKMAINYLTI